MLIKASTAKEKVELSAVGTLAKDNGGEIKRNHLNDELTSYMLKKIENTTMCGFLLSSKVHNLVCA